MNRTPAWAVTVIALGLTLITGAATVACAATNSQREQTEWVETEDCDAEDWAHYEPECHRVSPKPKPTATKTKAVLAPTPAPRRSTR